MREVSGLPGSFVVNEARLEDVQAAAFSQAGGIVLSRGRLLLLDAGCNRVADVTVDGPAVLGIGSSLKAAVAWTPKDRALYIWNGKSFETIPTAGVPEDAIRSASREGSNAVLLSDSLTITVSLTTGNVVDCRMHGNGAVLKLSESLGARKDDLSVEQMNDRWIHAWSGVRHWAARITGEPIVLELPAPRGSK